MESPTYTYHRNPTKAEVNFGEGSIHYRDFTSKDCMKDDGSLKVWFVSQDDSLRYYS